MKFKRKAKIATTILAGLLMVPFAVACANPFSSSFIRRDVDGNLIYSFSANLNSPNFRFAIPNPDANGSDEIVWNYNLGVSDGEGPAPENPNLTEKLRYSAPNDIYKNAFKNTFEIKFLNEDFSDPNNRRTSGILATTWILDYEIPDDDKTYPTTFYLATNLHVANGLIGGEDDPRSKTSRTRAIVLTQFMPPESQTNLQIDGSQESAQYKRYIWKDDRVESDIPRFASFANGPDRNPSQFKVDALLAKKPRVVYTGIDYLESSPKRWNSRFTSEEAIDFAVLEVQFASPEIARVATNNYASDTQINRHFSLPERSLLTRATQEPLPLSQRARNYYIAGFPQGVPSVNRNARGTLKSTLPTIREDNNYTEREKQQILNGQALSNFQPYSTTGTIRANGIGDSLLMFPNFQLGYHGSNYNVQGLTYAFNDSGLRGGSSGSAIYNTQGNIIALNSLGNSFNDVNVSFALISDGFRHPEYRTYTTPKYNLIFGGVAGQKTNYLDSLLALNRDIPNFRTALSVERVSNNLS